MMAATSAMSAVNPFIHANSSDAGGNSSTASSTISANDFLTLLVTEMKNQDPTAQTDPNQYVNQLVQVNSLEQLIEINQNTTTVSHSTGTTTGKGVQGKMVGAPDLGGPGGTGTGGTSHPIAVSGNPIPAVSGNLGIPAANPAAHRVAQALSGRR